MSRKLLGLLLATMVLSVVLTGCAGLPSAGTAQQAVCQALTRLTDPLDQFAAKGGNATTADVKALKNTLDGAVKAVETANKALNSEPINGLVTAYKGLAETVDALPADAPLGADASAKIKTGVDGIQAALKQATSSLSCK